MEPKQKEITHRSNLFMACMIAGLALMPVVLRVYTWMVTTLDHHGILLPGWFSSLLGLTMAFLPVVLLIQLARRRLNRLYPDSLPRKVPEAWERKQ